MSSAPTPPRRSGAPPRDDLPRRLRASAEIARAVIRGIVYVPLGFGTSAGVRDALLARQELHVRLALARVDREPDDPEARASLRRQAAAYRLIEAGMAHDRPLLDAASTAR